MDVLEHYQQSEARRLKRLAFYKGRFQQYAIYKSFTPVQAIVHLAALFKSNADAANAEIDALVDPEYHSSQLPQ